ncbi:MAG: ABC transporter substrate-binding protein [Candidatus Bathyarchaeia archaeon]
MKRNAGVTRTTWMAIAVIVIVVIAAVIGAWYFTRPQPAGLTVFSLWSGDEEKNFKEVLDNFTKQTGINVTHVGFSTQELLIGVPTQLKAGASIADLVIAPWPAWILDLAEDKHLVEVTDLITAAKYPTGYIDSVKDGAGKIWATPFKASGKPGFWYKKSFFQDNNLEVPDTYQEFKDLLAALTQIAGIEAPIASGDTVGWPLSDTTEAFIMGLGGYQMQQNLIDGTVNWTSTEVRSVFEDLRQLLAAGYFSEPAEWTAQVTKLWNEEYGIYFMGSWITTMSQIGDVSDLDFFPFPETDGVAGAVDYAIIPKYTQNLDQAKQLLQYLAGAEAQETMVKLGGFLGTHIDVPDAAYSTLDKKVLDFISQPTIHIVSDLDDAVGGRFQTTFWDQLKLLWVDPTTSTMDSVLAALQEEAP